MNPADIVHHVVNTTQAARDYAVCLSYEDPITRAAILGSHTFETAKRRTGYLHAKKWRDVALNDEQTIGAVTLVVDGWYVHCVVDLRTGALLSVDDERKPIGRVA